MSLPKTLTATAFRNILAVLLFVIAIGIGAIFYFGRTTLLDTSTTVNKAVADAQESSRSLDTFKKIETDLKTNQDAVTRAKQLTADLFDYNYQNQIIKDLQAYGKQNNVGITGVDFGTGTVGTGAATPATPPPTGAAAPAANTGTASGGKSVTIKISLSNPVDYKGLLSFVYAIEQNLPKMQISALTLTRNHDNPSAVDVGDITMIMYVK